MRIMRCEARKLHFWKVSIDPLFKLCELRLKQEVLQMEDGLYQQDLTARIIQVWCGSC